MNFYCTFALCNNTKKEGIALMPLTFADTAEENVIKRIGGNPEVKRHLENLGFTVGECVSVIQTVGGNVIVKVRETRVAISKEMAQKIMI